MIARSFMKMEIFILVNVKYTLDQRKQGNGVQYMLEENTCERYVKCV
jgi:hypothetical protein